MEDMNILVIALAALVPLITGFVWYHPKVFGSAWMKATGLTDESLKDFNMIKVFSLTYLLSVMVAIILQPIVIHQFGIYSVLMSEPGFGEEGSEITLYINSFMEKYGTNFRSFQHGLLHGVIAGFFIALPVIGINALFERKNFKYVAINAGFWIFCLGIMGGIICAYA